MTPNVTDTAFVLALASLTDMGPARLQALLEARSPADAWASVCAGTMPAVLRALLGAKADDLIERWGREARALDPADVGRRHDEADIEVITRDEARFPHRLQVDAHPPVLLCARGDLGALDGPSAAVVGTRDCTNAGRDTAFSLGHDLAAAGVRVVSGLALGIDGAAHAGALEAACAPPIGVVGSGLDVVYPKRNASLWRAVARHGLLLTEHPLGVPPTGWHFLARNRLIAALADAVVVVESHASGGALVTAEQADARGRPLLAVPGPVRSPASVGSNRLLFHARPCLDASDVLAVLGVDAPLRPVERDDRRPPSAPDIAVLDALGWQPTSLEQALLATGLSLGALSLALDRLEADGWIVRRGGWIERIGTSS